MVWVIVVMVICIFDDADFPGQSKLTKLHAFTWPKEPLLDTSEDITITLKTITITTITTISITPWASTEIKKIVAIPS